MTDIILQSHSLRKEFGALVAVDDVDMSIRQNTLHSIIGPNGAGKTTFFNLLSGKYKPTGGRVMFKGQDITDMPFHRRAHMGIGRSFQITNIFPNLTILENVRLAAQAVSPQAFNFWGTVVHHKDLIDRAMHVLDIVGLAGDSLRLASVLPHGDKRKLELAILLAPDPDVLLLDEPTAGMASEQVPEIIGTIDNISKAHDKTVVMVEHNMSVVMGISDVITVMDQGRLLAEGTPSEIANNKTVQDVYLGRLYGDADELIGKDA
ncbi:MAG: ABC transporter ATP-binding protein [Anaerolineaceae bacterium]|nr:MAG: ABC transporter ATP-binding protein [Anaerolineaceae bacterium]